MSKKDEITTFEKLERLNAQIDVWIDDENYKEIEKKCKPENDLLGTVKAVFQGAAKSPNRDFSKLLKKRDTYLKETLLQQDKEWQALLWAKYLRAQIQKQGTDDFAELLDNVTFFLQRRLPENNSFFQHLYYQEIAACAHPGEESLGAAKRAYNLVPKRETILWEQSFRRKLYLLWARLNMGIGYRHSKQSEKAEHEFNQIIKEFSSEAIAESKHYGLWKDLILYPAILNKAELQEVLQFSYHTLETLSTLNGLTSQGAKWQRKLIKEALAYRDMGRLDEAEQAFAKLLGRTSLPKSVKKAFAAYDQWRKRKTQPGRNVATQCLQALIDYYIAKLETDEEYTTEAKDFAQVLCVDFEQYRKELRLDKAPKEMAAFYTQLARYLKWLAYNNNAAKKTFERLYTKYEGKLKDPSLEFFEEYQYNIFSSSMEKCYEKLNGWQRSNAGMQYKDDELLFLEKLNQFEKKRNWLYAFKRFERELRANCIIKNGWADCNKNKGGMPCFTDDSKADKAFCGLLNCSQECKGLQNTKLLDYDYDTIINRENKRFRDRLEYRSKHARPSEIVESYHFLGLQRWNSHTPTFTLSPGGGYFLYRQDKDLNVDVGIAIDPGFDFIDNLFHMGFTLKDIDFVLITHAHLDHMRDLEPIISSLFELKKQKHQSAKNKLHVIMTRAVYQRVEHVITNHILREFLADTYIVDVNGRLDANRDLVTFKFRKLKGHFVSILDDNKVADLHISAKRAYHNDYSDCSDAFGYVVDFIEGDAKKPVFSFGYTGDTKYQEKIAEQYAKCHAVCVHLNKIARK